MQLILTLLFFALMVGIFILVYLMWRTDTKRTAKMEQTLIDVAEKSAETARRLSGILEEKEPPK